jgi:hypothetical protein
VVLLFRDSSSEAEVRFLSPNAPSDLLYSGAKFCLYEGALKVAEIVVV